VGGAVQPALPPFAREVDDLAALRDAVAGSAG